MHPHARSRRDRALPPGAARQPGPDPLNGLALAAAAAAFIGGPEPGGAAAASDLTDRQLAGQRVVFAYHGLRPPRALVRRVARGEAAGVILFSHNVGPGLRTQVARLQRAARRSPVRAPLLVMVDQEGGLVRRLPGGPRRSAAATGGSRAAARADGRAAGRALRAVGANVDLAPVADVCRPGSALERERRCYGRSPRTVARLAGAFAAGLRAQRVLPTLKHFPGFGAARVNTDFRRQVITTGLGRLRAVDERPFAALRSTPLVMLSTAVYPALSRRPAALAHAVATRELRERLGYRGVSITDALGTPAVARFGSYGNRAFQAARAGTDLVLFGGGYGPGSRAAQALERALRSDRLARDAFERSAGRVLALRSSLSR